MEIPVLGNIYVTMSKEIDYHRIYVDQLRDGKVELIDRHFPSETMDVHDDELSFEKEIHVKGEAYVSEGSLILHVDLIAEAVIPCSICNEPVETPVVAKGVYHIVPFEEIKGHVFDMTDMVRENILLNTPSFSECGGGSCKQREFLGKYMRNSDDSQQEPFEGQQPFKDL